MTATVKRKRGRPSNADRITATAYQPNIRDGASTHRAIRTRIRLLAAERGLTQSDIHAALTVNTYDIMHFAKRHRVSLDWLICGDLKGLLRTVKGCPSRPQQPVLDPWYESGLLLESSATKNCFRQP